jgi:hypothetical protein
MSLCRVGVNKGFEYKYIQIPAGPFSFWSVMVPFFLFFKKLILKFYSFIPLIFRFHNEKD